MHGQWPWLTAAAAAAAAGAADCAHKPQRCQSFGRSSLSSAARARATTVGGSVAATATPMVALQFYGHAVHVESYDDYYVSLVAKKEGREKYEGMFSIDLNRGEFLSPVCKNICNLLVPAMVSQPYGMAGTRRFSVLVPVGACSVRRTYVVCGVQYMRDVSYRESFECRVLSLSRGSARGARHHRPHGCPGRQRALKPPYALPVGGMAAGVLCGRVPGRGRSCRRRRRAHGG